MATYLPPIEKPQGLFMKLVYFFTRRQFGKVMTPLTVFSARMPTAFMTFYGKCPGWTRSSSWQRRPPC